MIANRNKLIQAIHAKNELIKRAAWDDFYIFAKLVCGNDLMEEVPHRELCEFITLGLDKSEHLELNFKPPVSTEYVKKCEGKLKKLIMLPRGAFKCLKKGTKVLMHDGGAKNIEDLRNGDYVVGYDNDTLQPVKSMVTHQDSTGVKDVYTITTDNGQFDITATKEHRFYTPDGYKEMGSLKVGDWVAVSANTNKDAEPDYPITDAALKFVAYMIFEGSVTGGRCSFTNFDEEIQRDFTECCDNLGFGITEYTDGQYSVYAKDINNRYNYNPRILLRGYEAYGVKAVDKYLPKWVYMLSRRQKWLFLSIALATDGYITTDTTYRGNNRKPKSIIGINLGSKRLIKDLQILLLTLGVRGTKCSYKIENKYNGYSLIVSDACEILKFIEMNYPFDIKSDRLKLAIENSLLKGDAVNDLLPINVRGNLKQNKYFYRKTHGIRLDNDYTLTRQKVGRILEIEPDNTYLRKYYDSPLRWVKISNIEYAGEYETYDIETETSNYVADGFMVHNSSVVTKCLPLWLLWHNQNLRIMIDSEVLGNAKKYLFAIKDLIKNNEMLRYVCTDENGNFLLEGNDKIAGGWTDEQIILKHRSKMGIKEASIFCAGVDNAQTGMHPDVIIMDDLVSERNVGTSGQIEKVKDHYRFSLSLLEPGGLQVVIGTRYHMADLYGDLLELDTFEQMVRPAIDEYGELYFPSRLSKEFLSDMKKEQGSYIFNCQYMLDPIDDSNAIFKKEHIQYYDKLPPIVARYILIDLAISQKETADYTVIMCVGITADKKIYVIEYDRGRYLPNDIIDNIFKMYNKYKVHGNVKAVGIETVAFQKAMVYLIRDEMRRRGIYMPLRELKADTDKKRRIGALQPLFENGDVYMRITHKELEQELLEFPFSEHDDTVDSLAYILQVLRPGNYNTSKYKYNYKPLNSITGY